MANDIRDLVDPAELVGVVRALEFPALSLGNFFPVDLRDEVDYSFTRGGEDPFRAAPVRAFDAEAAIGSRPGLSKTRGALPPISMKIALTEGDRLMHRAINGDERSLVEGIYDDAARMALACETRLELARGDALTDGVVTIAENGMQFSIDYGVPSAHKVVAAASWANPATDVLGDWMNWTEVYVDTNGIPPGIALTSTPVIGQMLRNEAIRDLAGGMVTFDTLNAIAAANELPTIVRYDTKVTKPDGTARERIIPQDRFIMLPGPDSAFPLGQTQMGVTVEAQELVNEGLLPTNEGPGIVAVAWKTKDPVQIWTKAACIGLPVIPNPDLLFTADVNP